MHTQRANRIAARQLVSTICWHLSGRTIADFVLHQPDAANDAMDYPAASTQIFRFLGLVVQVNHPETNPYEGEPKPMKSAAVDVFYELTETIDQVREPESIPSLLRSISQLYGLKTIAYLGVGATRIGDTEPYIAVTYSPNWVAHYKNENYLFIDPVIRQGFNRLMPLDWGEFDRTDVRARQFLGEAVEFGLGRQGLTFPVKGMREDRALVTITSEANDREWQAARRHYTRDFQAMSGHLHEMVLRTGGINAPQTKLTKRQVECLWWTSQGKKVPEIAIILELSHHTVRNYLEEAREKLNATSNPHAAFKAAQQGLLFPGL